ncbi:MAG TPA: DUF6338 family protein [Candidatus Baltobacteraceae bacterium]|nr:DUF6338 family protein [Candidatus Baltobacteraceae bacterium]
MNDLLWSPVYPFGKQNGFPTALSAWLFSIIVLIVSPAMLTWGYARLVDLAASNAWIPSPISRPWDHFFQRVVKEQSGHAVGVIITLRDGRRIGGAYTKPGFASSFPTEEQLLLGETWLLDENGSFKERVAGSLGLLIDNDDILTLEFFTWAHVIGGQNA